MADENHGHFAIVVRDTMKGFAGWPCVSRNNICDCVCDCCFACGTRKLIYRGAVPSAHKVTVGRDAIINFHPKATEHDGGETMTYSLL